MQTSGTGKSCNLSASYKRESFVTLQLQFDKPGIPVVYESLGVSSTTQEFQLTKSTKFSKLKKRSNQTVKFKIRFIELPRVDISYISEHTFLKNHFPYDPTLCNVQVAKFSSQPVS
jgi:hypothetical protein